MNNDDERDYDEEAFNRRILETEDGEREPGPQLENPDEYWDLAARVEAVTNSYNDFEGFCDPARILPLLKDSEVVTRLEVWADVDYPLEFARDMLLHYAHESLDYTGEVVTTEQACTFLDTLAWILQARYWKRVKDDELNA